MSKVDTPLFRQYKVQMTRPIVAFLFLLILGFTACTLPETTPPPPTNTPGPSPTPTITPTLTPSPTPSPTPTPLPAARVETGDKALFYGNYFRAREEYQIVLQSSTDADLRAAALWGLGKTDFISGNLAGALSNLRALVNTYPNAPHAIQAQFLLGETYYSLERYEESAAAYLAYQQARPGLLDAYVLERRGNALAAIGQYDNAISSYEAALLAPDQANPIALRIKIGQTYFRAGDAARALQLYEEILPAAPDDFARAQLDLLAGQAHLQLGQSQEAYARWQNTVNNYPLAFDSYSALVGLVNAGQPVDEFNRGLVDYFAGQYGVALAAFDRYIRATPNHDGTALYYRALTNRSLGNYEAAVIDYDQFIASYQTNRYWGAAWSERAFILWAYLEQHNQAAQSLEQFAAEVAGSPLTVTYLLDAGRIYERNGDLENAARTWESIADNHPSSTNAVRALFLAGITRYRLGDDMRALANFQRALLLSTEISDQASNLLWVGKTYQRMGKTEEARAAWQQAQTLDTSYYYSLRARELLVNQAPFQPRNNLNLNYDLAAERKDAEAWMRIVFEYPSETNLSSLGSLQSDPRLQRGLELWEIGLYDRAHAEFESLRLAVQQDPAESFRLGNYLVDLGAYRSGIQALRQVLTLAGLEQHSASLTAPIYFRHIRYGLYYSEIIFPAAQEYNFDPLFITSVVRQESLFEGFVRSSAGARGLMQIIPSTGAGIAEQMGWPPGYTSEDLYSPYINVRMGTFYLNSNRKLLNDYYAMLAGYNAGPGNAAIWQTLAASDDPDLLLEIIRFQETRDYIRYIYEAYNIYQNLYGPTQ